MCEEIELKPCLFCGGHGKAWRNELGYETAYVCNDKSCGAEVVSQ